jgi:hypothetical protein
MKKRTTLILMLILAFGVAFLALYSQRNNQLEKKIILSQKINESSAPQETALEQNKSKIQAENKIPDFLPPLDLARERVTKKTFGLFVTPQNSPVQLEKFRGYHTGTDFEIFPGEDNIDIPVKAVCSGNILMKKIATGYGGIMVESCSLNGEPITVVYGHLKLANINYNVGDKINTADVLGILGKGYSAETSGERKHLHLGFHKGAAVNIFGYVQNKSELSGWLDPCLYVCE